MKKGKGKQEKSISRQDVARRLAELAYGRANDCVRLVLEEQPELDALDLSLLSEVRRNDKGTVEIRLIDRLQALEQLAALAEADNSGMEAFLRVMEGAEA
ncbi:MAG: terminase small subunit [Oscillospiraceae bacterium]|nr:terminase small subunit [Oscillospiraceae bacterium]